MAYVSLYRKYRPQTFADVMGQEHVTRTLQNALRGGRVAHGYLFTGTRGTAKTTVARLLAKALNCDQGPAPEPCNRCDACTSITEGSCIDVVEMDAASHRGVADIEEIRKQVGYGPMQFRSKVFIVDEAHQLSSDAKDAFLKTLEEPPDNVVFLLATTEPQSIPITIRSRCQQFDFRRGSLADIARRLRYVLDCEGVTYTPEAVTLVARNAEGSWRDALSLLEQVLAFAPKHLSAGDVDAVLGTLDAEGLARVVEVVARRDAPGAFALAGELLDAGKEARTLLRTLSAHFRDLLLVSVGGPAVPLELTPEEAGRLQEQARRFSPPQMMRAMDVLNEAQGETRWNNQQRLLVELTFLKLMDLGDGTSPAGAAFATAPIVFPAAAPQVPPAMSPPAPPITPPAPGGYPGAGGASPEAGSDEMPASYFSAEDRADEDDEDEYLPAEEDERSAPVNVALSGTDEEEPGLFEEPSAAPPAAPKPEADVPVDPATPPAPAGHRFLADAADATRELDALMTPGRGAGPVVSGERDPAPAAEGGFTVERVLQVWPRFLQDAERISKQAAVMMASSVPTGAAGTVVTITFTTRANYEMMSFPKKQEFVRKLLARCLDVDNVRVNFVLDTTVSPPKPTRRPRASRERDLVAALDQPPPSDGFDELVTPRAYPAPSAFAPAPPGREKRAAPEAPAPSHTASGADDAASAARAAAMNEPLVQEALSIFGGEIVDD